VAARHFVYSSMTLLPVSDIRAIDTELVS